MRYSRRTERAPRKAASKARRVVVAAFAVTVSMVAGPSSGAAETLRIGKAGREAFSFVPVDVGAQIGIFKKHGLDLEISSFGGDARIQQAMTADGIDVGSVPVRALPSLSKAPRSRGSPPWPGRRSCLR
jgi:ABC-type nitrate/sulfonate/bicarbonate transport system substrate-binding protein